MPALKLWKKIGSGLSALNAVTDEVPPSMMNSCQELSFFIVGSAAIASGAVQPEEAHITAYAGTWAPIGSPVTVPASTVKSVKASGMGQVARVRVSTVFAGGTVDVWVGVKQ